MQMKTQKKTQMCSDFYLLSLVQSKRTPRVREVLDKQLPPFLKCKYKYKHKYKYKYKYKRAMGAGAEIYKWKLLQNAKCYFSSNICPHSAFS